MEKNRNEDIYSSADLSSDPEDIIDESDVETPADEPNEQENVTDESDVETPVDEPNEQENVTDESNIETPADEPNEQENVTDESNIETPADELSERESVTDENDIQSNVSEQENSEEIVFDEEGVKTVVKEQDGYVFLGDKKYDINGNIIKEKVVEEKPKKTFKQKVKDFFSHPLTYIIITAIVVLGVVAGILLAILLPIFKSKHYTPKADRLDVTSVNVTVDWSNDRTCKVTQNVELKFNTDETYFTVDIVPCKSGVKIRDFNFEIQNDYLYVPYKVHNAVNNIMLTVGGNSSRLGYVCFQEGDTFGFDISYTLALTGNKNLDLIDIDIFSNKWEFDVHKVVMTVNYPQAPNLSQQDGLGIFVGNDCVAFDNENIVWSNDGKTLKYEVKEISTKTGISIKSRMPDGTMTKYSDNEYLLLIIAGGALIALTLLIKLIFGLNKPCKVVESPNIPKLNDSEVNPVIVGGNNATFCSRKDIATILFHWANQGIIDIVDSGKVCEDTGMPKSLEKANADMSDIYIIKNRELENGDEFERALFNELFIASPEYVKKRKDGRQQINLFVAKNRVFTGFSNKTKKISKELDRNKKVGYKESSNIASAVTTLLVIAFAWIFSAFLPTFRGFNKYVDWAFGSGLSIFFVPIVQAIASILFDNSRFRKDLRKLRIFHLITFVTSFVLIVGIGMISFPKNVISVGEKIWFAFVLSVSCEIALSIHKREPESAKLNNSIECFKKFICNADKQTLQRLVAEDPQYYYKVLPYAETLGLRAEWNKKFKDIDFSLSPHIVTLNNEEDSSLAKISATNRLLNNVTYWYS